MVLPWPVFAIKFAAWAVGIIFVLISKQREMGTITTGHATDCSIGSPNILLSYRIIFFLWSLYIGVRQLISRGPGVFTYFTVWNWWLMTIFFFLASIASIIRVKSGIKTGDRPASFLDRVVVVMFGVETPMTWLVSLSTWCLLVPTLITMSNDPRIEMTTDWRRIMFSFESYNQHGFNAVMMFGELVLTKSPPLFWAGGWLALWGSAFGIWSTIFLYRNGRFIYPFLDVSEERVNLMYLGFSMSFWGVSLVFLGSVHSRNRVYEYLEKKGIIGFETTTTTTTTTRKSARLAATGTACSAMKQGPNKKEQ